MGNSAATVDRTASKRSRGLIAPTKPIAPSARPGLGRP